MSASPLSPIEHCRFEQLIVLGVSGSGKTTLGKGLAAYYDFTFLDADDFHSAEAKAKMASGEGLTDADRAPWLAKMRSALDEYAIKHQGVVLACSALKVSYRQALRGPHTGFIYLDVPHDVLRSRLEARQGSYAKVSLLPSQLAALEAPSSDEALIVHVTTDETADLVLADALKQLSTQEKKHAD